MLFTIESSFHTLLTHFEPLYANKYLKGPSDGAVSLYAFKLEINGVTFARIGKKTSGVNIEKFSISLRIDIYIFF